MPAICQRKAFFKKKKSELFEFCLKLSVPQFRMYRRLLWSGTDIFFQIVSQKIDITKMWLFRLFWFFGLKYWRPWRQFQTKIWRKIMQTYLRNLYYIYKTHKNRKCIASTTHVNFGPKRNNTMKIKQAHTHKLIICYKYNKHARPTTTIQMYRLIHIAFKRKHSFNCSPYFSQ